MKKKLPIFFFLFLGLSLAKAQSLDEEFEAKIASSIYMYAEEQTSIPPGTAAARDLEDFSGKVAVLTMTCFGGASKHEPRDDVDLFKRLLLTYENILKIKNWNNTVVAALERRYETDTGKWKCSGRGAAFAVEPGCQAINSLVVVGMELYPMLSRCAINAANDVHREGENAEQRTGNQ